jgi:hypothetical protein
VGVQAKAVVGSQAVFVYVPSVLGNHTIDVFYTGDGNFNASSTAGHSFIQTVNNAVNVAVVSSANPGIFGQPVTFTAVVSPVIAGQQTPTGTVIFFVDGMASNPVGLVNGQASITLSTLTPGTHQIIAFYSGDNAFGAWSGVVAEAIQLPSAASVTSSQNPSLQFTPVAFTVAVVGAISGTGAPTSGTVVFFLDGVPSFQTSLDATGHATWTTAGVPVGNHQIAVYFAGSNDGSFAPVSSAPVVQTVQPRVAFMQGSVTQNGVTQGSGGTVFTFDPMMLVVTAFNAQGQPATNINDVGTWTLISAPNPGGAVLNPAGVPLPQQFQFQFTNGQAVFQNIMVNLAGTYIIDFNVDATDYQFVLTSPGRQT